MIETDKQLNNQYNEFQENIENEEESHEMTEEEKQKYEMTRKGAEFTIQQSKFRLKCIYAMIAIGYIFATVVIIFCFPKMYSIPTTIFWLIVFNIYFYLITFNAYMTSTVQPDVIPSRFYTVDEEKKHLHKYCKICQKYKANRVHHCKIIDKCVYRYDHYCTLLANTVGYHNHKYFAMFQFCIVIAVWTSFLHLGKANAMFGKEHLSKWFFVAINLFVLNVTFSVIVVFAVQLICLGFNLTMLEFMEWMQDMFFNRRFFKPEHCKDSFLSNMKEMLLVPENRCVLWGFLPLPPSFFEKELEGGLHQD